MNWPTASATHESSNFVGSRACMATHLTKEVFDLRISSALSSMQKLQADIHNDYVRCPYLATIEIERRWRLEGKCDDGKLMEALVNYFERFSHMSCFSSDVELFLRILSHNEKAELLEKFVRISESLSMAPLKKLGQAITIFKVQELLGVMFTLPIAEVEGTAVRMVEMYNKILPLSRDLDPQENMHGEELLSMASSVLVLLFWRTRHLGYFLEAILVLEFGLNIRPYVWQYKMLLVHLCSYLGALPLAYEWFCTLDIKNILLETVSHHILPELWGSPLWLETTDLLKEYLKFMDDYFRDAADLTFLAYRHRNYSKVIEFVQFKERLQHSNQYLVARVEASILQLKQRADSLEEVECLLENLNYGIQLLELSNEEKLNALTFNEDLQARPWWSPTCNVNYLSERFEGASACLRENLYSHEVGEKEGTARKIIERKSLLLRLVYLAIQTASASWRENVEPNGSMPDVNSNGELKCLLERYASNIGLPFDDAINMIVGISKGKKSFEDFGSDLVYWMNFAVFVNAWNLCSHHPGLLNGDGCNPSSWHILDSLIKTCIAEQLTLAQPVRTSPGSNLPVLVQLVTESFSWHILVIQSCVRSMLPSGKKKKRSGAGDQLNLPQVQALRGSIQCLTNAIQEVEQWLGDQILKREDENLDTLLSHLKKKENEEGPGLVFQILEDNATANNSELGGRMSGALQSWSSAGVVRKLVGAQNTLLSRFHGICCSKLKLLESLKQSF